MTIDMFLSDYRLFGLALGLATFLIIGLFHPLVIKAEYYLGVESWVCFFFGGVLFSLYAVYIESHFFSALSGVTAFSSFWSILEVFEQKNRVKKGWFPANPNKKEPSLAGLRAKSEGILLYSGLALLLLSFIVRSIDLPIYCFWILFGLAITCKTLFLIALFSKKGFKMALWLYFIIAGVALILLSLLFKKIIPHPMVYKVVFFSAIAVKTTGLMLLFFQKRPK